MTVSPCLDLPPGALPTLPMLLGLLWGCDEDIEPGATCQEIDPSLWVGSLNFLD